MFVRKLEEMDWDVGAEFAKLPRGVLVGVKWQLVDNVVKADIDLLTLNLVWEPWCSTA